jgi:hypothetical protein
MRAIPDELIVTNSAYAMDGGSIFLMMEGPRGVTHTLHVPQHGLGGNLRPGEPILAFVESPEFVEVVRSHGRIP